MMLTLLKEALSPTSSLVISLPKELPHYWEGDPLEGSVTVLSIAYPYDGELVLKLKVKEEGRITTNIKPSALNKTIFLETKKVSISKKRHHIPFQFEIPKESPGTFNFALQKLGRIHYYISASLRAPNKLKQKAVHPLAVFERVKGSAVPIRASSKLFSSSSDTSIVSLWLYKNVYFPGEIALLRLKIANQTSQSLAVKIKLVHVLSTEVESLAYYHPIATMDLPQFNPFYYGVSWIPIEMPDIMPLASTNGTMRSKIHIQDISSKYIFLFSCSIYSQQQVASLHPQPQGLNIPPALEIRPVIQQLEKPFKCSLCSTPINRVLRQHRNCFHCGKMCCSECIRDSICIPKLKYDYRAVRVCRTCYRIVEETGGVKFQNVNQITAEWGKKLEESWVPKCSKKHYTWREVIQREHNPYFQAVAENRQIDAKKASI